MIIREMKAGDMASVLDIEAVSFIAPWNESQFQYELTGNPFSHLYVAVENDIVVGFIDFWITFDSAAVNQIAVLPALRRKGIASVIMKDALTRMVKTGVRTVTLEVRTTNDKAIAFYEKTGFIIRLTKSAYYDNGDDAYYMEKNLDL